MSKQTANQRYKESKSDLPFREWLRSEQQVGNLADHEKMFNADGMEEKPTIKKSKSNMIGLNILGMVALGSLVYGLSQVSKANVE